MRKFFGCKYLLHALAIKLMFASAINVFFSILVFGVVLAQDTPSALVSITTSISQTPVSNVVLQENLEGTASDSSSSFFSSPILVGVLWPVAFVVLSITLNSLALSDNGIGGLGQGKFTVKMIHTAKYQVRNFDSIELLKDILNDQNIEIRNIDVSSTDLFESLNIAIDLCVGAIATDLSIVYSLAISNPNQDVRVSMATVISVMMLHFIIASAAGFILRFGTNNESQKIRRFSVQFSNFLGIVSVLTSFIILGRILIS